MQWLHMDMHTCTLGYNIMGLSLLHILLFMYNQTKVTAFLHVTGQGAKWDLILQMLYIL